MPEKANREKDIFSEALEMSSPDARFAYVRRVCEADHALRQRVEALLQAHEGAGDFISTRDGPIEEVPSLPTRVQLTEGPGTVIDRYQLLQNIGEGGFGTVYLAEQKEPVKRRVALKIIKLGMDTRQVVGRFEAERQALALMDHPSIAKVLDAGATDSGRPYFVMELVGGVAITQFCDEQHLPPVARLRLFTQVCRAIQHAHQKGIIHRDIKPSNILVTLHDGVPVPKVIDFGIAKATQQELTGKTVFTQFQQFIGTPAYMSPEQAEMSGLDIDTRSDIYGLGVLLYELLTGKTPFDLTALPACGLEEMRRKIREQEPVRPSARVSTMADAERIHVTQHRQSDGAKLVHLYRGDLDWIVMKCLEKDRTRRYETANSLAVGIERHLNNEPVVARPPSAAYRLGKAWRRNRLAFTAGTAVAVALVLGIGVSGWQAFEANRARNAEKQQRLQADFDKTEARRILYVSQMNLAQQAWEQSNLGRLRQLLEETKESPNRGFEWSYWQRQTHLPSKTLRGHLEEVTSVAFSPDGQKIITGSWDQTAIVWEVASGKGLAPLLGHTSKMRSMAISSDGQQIVTGGDDRTAKVWETANVWEAASGRFLRSLTKHNGRIMSVAFSPNGQQIVTGSWDQTAQVWEKASGLSARGDH